MCTICTRVQINLHNLKSWNKFAPGCKFWKHRSHGQNTPEVQICTRVQIAHMYEAFLGMKFLNQQGQLLEGVECHIYQYCFTFDGINLNRALVIIVLFPTKYSNKKVCANDIGRWKALWFYWYNFLGLLWLFPRPFSGWKFYIQLYGIKLRA